jgi:TRAP-type transport system periplasmic protein
MVAFKRTALDRGFRRVYFQGRMDLLRRLGLPWIVAAAAATTSAQVPAKPAGAVERVKLRVAHAYEKEHPFHKSFERFKEVLLAKSDGTIEVQIFPEAQLGNEQACVSLLRQGVLDVTTVSANGLEVVAPEVTFLDLLYLWKDREHWRRAFDGEVGERMTDHIRKGSSKGGAPPFEVLGYWGGSDVHMLSAKRGYETVEDLAGVKIRVQNSPLQFELWNALGAAPMSLDMDKIKDALRGGVVEAVPLTNTTNEKQRFYESAPHISQMGIAIVARCFLMSGITWGKLAPDQRAAVLAAAKEATATNRALEAELSDGALERIRALPGVTIYPFKDRAKMRERLRVVQERHADRLNLLDLLVSIDQEWEKAAPRSKK